MVESDLSRKKNKDILFKTKNPTTEKKGVKANHSSNNKFSYIRIDRDIFLLYVEQNNKLNLPNCKTISFRN
jgi:hypothetical protein